MIHDRLQQIETKIESIQNVPEDTKRELLDLLKTLRAEAGELAAKRPDDAQSIAEFAAASTHEATRSEKNPQLLQAALDGLTASVGVLEASHPNLAQAVNRIAVILSDMGI